MVGFIFGGDTQETPESLKRKREVAAALIGRAASAPRNVGEGLSAIGNALIYRGLAGDIEKGEAAGRKSADEVFAPVAAMLGGGSPATPSSAPSMPAPGAAAEMSATDPAAYRNAIASIESAGSGDYSAVGPTDPKLGRALGRYQVMEANIGPWSKEALGREVTPDEFLADPKIQDAVFDKKFGSYVNQYGPEGAAQAWFGGPGGVGKVGRQDSLGTSVGEYGNKFTKALGGNAQVAQALTTPQQPQVDTGAIMKALSNPFLSQGQRAVAEALLQQDTQRRNATYEQQLKQADPAYQVGLEKSRLELRNLEQPPEPDSVRSLRARAEAAGLKPGTQEFSNFMITQGVKPPANVGTPPAGYQIKYDEAGNPVSMAPIPGGPADTSKKDQAAEDSRDTSTFVITTAAQRARDAMKADGLPANGLIGSIAAVSPSTNAAELRRQVGVLTSNATIENLNAMRQQSPTGGALGNVTEGEGKMLAAKAGTLDPNSPNFARDLDDYERTLLKIVHGDKRGEEVFNATRKQETAPAVPKGEDMAPEGVDPAIWKFMTPEEKKLWQN